MTQYALENGDREVGDRLGLDLQPLVVVAERSGVSYSTLCTWVDDPMRTASLPFNVADELLCACDLYHLWWGELNEYYEHVDLNWKKCERDGCETWFKVSSRKNHQLGPKARKYCGRACAQMQHLKESGRISKSDKHNSKTHCRNGHKRTAANAKPKGGCRDCDRIREITRRTHCVKGHEFTPENTMLLKSGKRRCRKCNNATSAAGYSRRRQAA